MTEKERVAYEIAAKRIASAIEGYDCALNISGTENPFTDRDKDYRGDKRLQNLRYLPPEIQELKHLERLWMHSTKISSIDLLGDLQNLKTLRLNNTPVSELESLRNHWKLERLWINDTRVEDHNQLINLTGLRSLSANRSKIRDIHFVEYMPRLESLMINNTPISTLNNVGKCSNLKQLHLNNTKISDLTPLSSIESLQSLWIHNTLVSDMRPLATLDNLADLRFKDTPAVSADSILAEISDIADDETRARETIKYLRRKIEPPDPRRTGPYFIVPDYPPISSQDYSMDVESDGEQTELHGECQIKALALLQIAWHAENTAPRLRTTIKRYSTLIDKDPADIGAKKIWSLANTLESIWELHQNAVTEARHGEELPPDVAVTLNDLLQTHRLWFLGHPGAREVWKVLQSSVPGVDDKDKREAAKKVVEAAKKSNIVEDEAISPALEDVETSDGRSKAALRALKALDDWAWNFIVAISRRLWKISKSPPGGFPVQTVAGAYLVQFVVANEPALAAYATQFMSYGPIWWDAMLAGVRRANLTPPGRE